MSNLHEWMWVQAREALDDASRLQRHFCALAPTTRVPSWSPPVDVFEIEGELLVVVVLPGVDPQDVEVKLGDGELTVAAPRRLPARLEGARILHMEIPLGHFERSIRLPRGSFRLAEVSLAEGLLRLRLTQPGRRRA